MELNKFLNGGNLKGYKVKSLIGNGMTPSQSEPNSNQKGIYYPYESIRQTAPYPDFSTHTISIQAKPDEKCMLTALYQDHTGYPTGIKKVVVDGEVIYDSEYARPLSLFNSHFNQIDQAVASALSRPFKTLELVLTATESNRTYNSVLSFNIGWADVVEDK